MVDNIFEYFPKITYKQQTLDYSPQVTNLMVRFVVQKIILEYGTIYYDCSIIDGERPDNIANKYYNNPKLDWLILMTNEILDPHFQWYMGHLDFTKYIKSKYGSLSTAHQTVHHYEEYVSLETYMDDGRRVPTRIVIVDLKTYNNTPDENRNVISCYEYEKIQNEARRKIKVIHQRYLPKILDELRTVFISKNGTQK